MSVQKTVPSDDVAGGDEVKEKAISYIDLPHKTQLGILCLVRIMEPLAATSINSYMFFQIRYLCPGASDAEVATNVGLLVGAKTVAKVFTTMLWGRFADSSSGGRKMVILIGLITSCISSVGYGMASTFPVAVAWQVFTGLVNSNVSISRTVVADLNPEKRFRSRALMLIAVMGSAGQFVGPLIGGFLSSTPGEGPFEAHPFLLPNLVIAGTYVAAILSVLFFLDETLESHDSKSNPFLRLFVAARAKFNRFTSSHKYSTVSFDDNLEEHPLDITDSSEELAAPPPHKMAFRDVWTPEVICTLIANFTFASHATSFGPVWVVFLSTPTDTSPKSFSFSGGIGLTTSSIGSIVSIGNLVGTLLQMIAYPSLNDRFDTVPLWRAGLLIFPFVYFFSPFPALLASSTLFLWASIGLVVFLGLIAKSVVTPGMTLLLNDCVPHQSARATVNTAGTTVAQLAKSLTPPIVLAVYGWGLKNGRIEVPFWILTGIAVAACVASRWVGNKQLVLKEVVREQEVERQEPRV